MGVSFDGARLLSRRGLVPGVVLAGLLLVLPSLGAGRHIDDLFHRMILSGVPNEASLTPEHRSLIQRGGPGDLFRFLDGDVEVTRKLRDLGSVPWWTVDSLRAGFFRPLTAMTHWLDYRLWPGHPALMHAQSLVWHGFLLLAAGLVLRRVFGSGVGAAAGAGLALVLYSIDDARAIPVAWLANRNAVIAGVFGLFSFLAFIRWREDKRALDGILSPLFLVGSLLSGEIGVGVIGFYFSYAVALDRSSLRARALSLLPSLLVVLVWRVVWLAMGFGVSGLGLYIDPGSQPLRFLGALVHRLPILLMGQLGFPPSDWAFLQVYLDFPLFSIVAWVGVLAFSLLFLPFFRRDPRARFLGLGMILSMIPGCATAPSERLLVFAGIGGSGLLSLFFFGHAERLASLAGRRWARGALRGARIGLLGIHFLIAPMLLFSQSGQPMGPESMNEDFKVSTVLDPSDPGIQDQTLVVVQAPSVFHVGFTLLECLFEERPAPRRIRVLAPSFSSVDVRRPDAFSLELTASPSYLVFPFDRLYRSEDRPLSVGDRVKLDGMEVEVLELDEAMRPKRASFRFSVPLEDSSLGWLVWNRGKFVEFVLPEVGGTRSLDLALPEM